MSEKLFSAISSAPIISDVNISKPKLERSINTLEDDNRCWRLVSLMRISFPQ